ncbi:hypothetical protein FKN13_20720 [Vibrio sp. 2-2(9)]|nr:hypothetical protein [Vibrio alginolyticus]NNN52569.1 hypothetical protein [Vibrio sp. 2-2(7)]NNN89844.1 hypothetical protein [Vibrio sp. 2-2(9)]
MSDFIHLLGVLTELYIQREKTLRSLASKMTMHLWDSRDFDEIVVSSKWVLTLPLQEGLSS